MTQPIVQPVVVSAATPVPSGTGDAEATGHPAVDEVLRSLDGVDARVLDEQVQVFEAAHARLHAVLADAGDDPTG